jgi:hypothetical protein
MKFLHPGSQLFPLVQNSQRISLAVKKTVTAADSGRNVFWTLFNSTDFVGIRCDGKKFNAKINSLGHSLGLILTNETAKSDKEIVIKNPAVSYFNNHIAYALANNVAHFLNVDKVGGNTQNIEDEILGAHFDSDQRQHLFTVGKKNKQLSIKTFGGNLTF